jgi:hypothetical protein
MCRWAKGAAKVRLTKTLGLSTVAAITAMALVGVISASATTGSTALCKTKELTCQTANQWPSGTIVKASLVPGKEAVLTGSLEVKCKVATVEGETLAALGTPTLLADIFAVTFSSCSGCNKTEALVSKAAPWLAHLQNLGSLKGLLTVLNPVVHLLECTIFKVKCTASAKEVALDVDTSVEPALVKAINEPLTLSGGVCGSTGTWNAEYEILSPKPAYIEA